MDWRLYGNGRSDPPQSQGANGKWRASTSDGCLGRGDAICSVRTRTCGGHERATPGGVSLSSKLSPVVTEDRRLNPLGARMHPHGQVYVSRACLAHEAIPTVPDVLIEDMHGEKERGGK